MLNKTVMSQQESVFQSVLKRNKFQVERSPEGLKITKAKDSQSTP